MNSNPKSLLRSQIVYKNLALNKEEQDDDPIDDNIDSSQKNNENQENLEISDSEFDNSDDEKSPTIDSAKDKLSGDEVVNETQHENDKIILNPKKVKESPKFHFELKRKSNANMQQKIHLPNDADSESLSESIDEISDGFLSQSANSDDIITHKNSNDDNSLPSSLLNQTNDSIQDSNTHNQFELDAFDDPLSEITSSQLHKTLNDENMEDIEPPSSHHANFLSSDNPDEIDITGHDDFFREEHIIMKFIEEETSELELFDCGHVRVLVCEHLPVDGESRNPEFEQIINSGSKYRIIVEAKKMQKELEAGTKFIMKLPFYVFPYHDCFGIIAPSFVQSYD